MTSYQVAILVIQLVLWGITAVAWLQVGTPKTLRSFVVQSASIALTLAGIAVVR